MLTSNGMLGHTARSDDNNTRICKTIWLEGAM